MIETRLFDLSRTLAARLFTRAEYPWEALDMLGEYIRRVGKRLNREIYEERGREIWIAKSASVSPSSTLKAPIIIGEGSKIGCNAYIGGAVIIGRCAVVGNGSEVRRSVIFDGARAPSRNYISDSVIGYNASLGAGAIISNMRADRGEVICSLFGEAVGSGRKRFGALVGDGAEIGCSSILSAGCVIERGARVNPLTRVRGHVTADRTYKGEKILSDIL